MPEGGIPLIPHEEILTYEEILRLVRVFATEGISKVRLTGGEPLVRKGIVDFVSRLSQIEEIKDLGSQSHYEWNPFKGVCSRSQKRWVKKDQYQFGLPGKREILPNHSEGRF